MPGRRPPEDATSHRTVARIPDQDEFRLRWAQVSLQDRRRILRAVNRGEVLDSRKHAALAVVLARRQQRFWRFAWVLGPVLSVPLAGVFDISGTTNLVAYALLGGAVLLATGTFFTRRARRAEQRNEQFAVHGRRET